jgi:hypothetical protein
VEAREPKYIGAFLNQEQLATQSESLKWGFTLVCFAIRSCHPLCASSPWEKANKEYNEFTALLDAACGGTFIIPPQSYTPALTCPVCAVC